MLTFNPFTRTTSDDQDWMDDAACKGRTTLFFGMAGERPERRVRREQAARQVCAGCPVLLSCRATARTGKENGFWGGESEEDRAAAGHAPRSISRRSVLIAGQGRRGSDDGPTSQAEAS
jgi:WhiB family redox-sensing transcriptional regulator